MRLALTPMGILWYLVTELCHDGDLRDHINMDVGESHSLAMQEEKALHVLKQKIYDLNWIAV